MSPTPRAALLLGAIALATLVVPVGVAAVAFATASRCTAARGLAPSSTLGRERVRRTIAVT